MKLDRRGGGEGVGRTGIPAPQSDGRGSGHILGDRLPVAPGPVRDGTEPFPQAKPAQHFADFDHTPLSVRHAPPLGRGKTRPSLAAGLRMGERF
jgi:hypothetical protein